MSYPHHPTSRPNMFRILPPGQHIIRRAARAGVNTRSRPEIEAWRRAGCPDHWENGHAE